jgi:hypothetical protein
VGDYFQSIVDIEATESETPKLAILIRNWLVPEGIILAQATDCILSSDLGYPPGPNYQKVVHEHNNHFLELWTNGLDIITKRHVFHSGQGKLDLVCRACADRVKPTEEWSQAVDKWYKDNQIQDLACPQCGHVEAVNLWKHDPDWGFGNLGFTFWNWPPLTDEFIKQFGERLEHNTVFVLGKL